MSSLATITDPDWIADTLAMVVEQGYRVTPVFSDNSTKPFRDGESYTSIDDYRGAVHIGVILDDAILIDYDGNKGEAPPLVSVAARLDVDLSVPVQSNKEGTSLHFLFRKPRGFEGKASADNFMDHVDMKTGNQLMHLKPHKAITDGELPKVEELAAASLPMLDLLRSIPRESHPSKVWDGSVEDVEKAQVILAAVDPNLPYDKWVHVLMGIHEKFGDTVTALDLADDWSSRGDNPARRDVIAGKMASFSSGGGITWGTVVHMAGGVPAVQGDQAPAPPSWMDGWFYLGCEDRFFNVNTGERFSTSAFNKCFNRHVGPKTTPAMMLCDEYHQRATYGLTYMPGAPQGVISVDGAPRLNAFKSDSVPEADPNWADHPDAWRLTHHIENLFGDNAKHVLGWMGYVVQNLGQKVQWAPLLKGVEGDGKTLTASMALAAIGKANARVIGTNEVRSQFSGWAENHALGIIEEIRIKGHNRHEVMNSLKPFITNDIVTIVRKGHDGYQTHNVANYMALTNFEDALAIDGNDRRWGVFFTRFQSSAQVKRELPASYFDPLWDLVEGHPEVVRGWLLSIDTSDFNPRRAPDSVDKETMVSKARSEQAESISEAIELGGRYVGEDAFAVKHLQLLMEDELKFKSLSPKGLSTAVYELGFIKLDIRPRLDGKQATIYYRKGAFEDVPRLQLGNAVIEILEGYQS